MEHGHSLMIPPHFDGNNYAYWKVRMKTFLKFIDEKVWNSVEYGWEKPTTPVSEWSTSQKEVAAFKRKTMNAIFNAVSVEEFKIISNVEVDHTAWNILQIVHEGIFAKFGLFQNQRGFCKIFRMGFEDLILKTSCNAFHVHYNCIFMHLVVCYTC